MCRKIRGIVGVAVALAAVFWPGMTSFVAVELIGLWAVLIGVVELVFAAILQRTDGPNWAFVWSLVNSARERNFLS